MFSISAMAVMLYFVTHKAIAVTEVSAEQAMLHADTHSGETIQKPLHFTQKDADGEYLYIPLETGISADSVSMENRYLDREVWVYIKGSTPDFYETNLLYGNSDGIVSAYYEAANETVILKFQLEKVSECESVVNNGKLSMHLKPPGELYDKIAVIDLSVSDSRQEEILMGVQEALKELAGLPEVRIYYVYSNENKLTDAQKAAFMKETEADFFIQLALNESEDSSLYGIEAYYPGEYYIPGFGNIEFADLLEREVTTALCGRANGLYPASQDNALLREAAIPSVQLKLGYISNEDEKVLLKDPDYQKKAAEGIQNALLKACSEER